MSNFSFKEKSTLGTLIATIVIGALYFQSAWKMWQVGALVPVSNFGLATGLTILLVMVLIGYHILVALLSRPEQEDERDRLITWRAGHIGGLVLSVGVIGVVLHVLIGSLWADPISASPVLIVNALMAVVFVATIVELSVTLVFYRRGL